MTTNEDILRQQCWDNALHALGTSAIFERRANTYRQRLRLLTFLGIVVPLAVGGMVLSFGTAPNYLPIVLTVAGILGLIQLIGSAWALVARWDDSLAYALESTTSNSRIANEYEQLARNPPTDIDTRVQIITAEDRLRSDLDTKQGITEEEKRRGMRAALRQYKRPCATCGKIPDSMIATDCPTCGQFK